MTEPKKENRMFVLDDGEVIRALKAQSYDEASDEVASYQGFTWICDEDSLKKLMRSAVAALHPHSMSNVVHHSQACVVSTDGVIEMWQVQGLKGWYPSKLAAEVAARDAFPDEDCSTRYARLSFKRFVQEDTL